MASKGYIVVKKTTTRYEFVSIGPKGQIKKRIEFTALRKKGYYNVAFGDIMKNGHVSDTVYSNNNDIVKIMTTVVNAMKDFLRENETAKLLFTGSTDDRTIFYKRILSRHYKYLSEHYAITALKEEESGNLIEVDFDPTGESRYLAFFVGKKE